MAAISLALDNSKDTAALHYRHLGVSVARSLELRDGDLEGVLLDRARGYTVSINDPVTAGHHCALGGNQNDFVVTSTLASQAPPAVGRALGGSLASAMNVAGANFDKRAVHFVSVGDGSVSNAHFISALNLAKYAQHRNFKCPVVFGISDNGVSISLKNYGFLETFLKDVGLEIYRCDGNDVDDVYRATKAAADKARRTKKPAVVVYSNLRRRFGHAATDRQNAYLSSDEIQHAADVDNVERACDFAVASGAMTYPEILEVFDGIEAMVVDSFDRASAEPKVTERSDVISKTSMPLVPTPRFDMSKTSTGRKDVMRKLMNRVIAETMTDYPESVYIGEDVAHGGYYLVTDGLDGKFPHRVRDFPPDETTLIGAGIGYSQAGLLPIVEIPYAKYLDCGFDMFAEAANSAWLNGGKSGAGMVVRLQGFGAGVFGGNMHTHTSLHLLPGVDVVCYSNGEDYARGFRNAVIQAKAGRMVMLVDCTDLLNRRHVIGKDRGWERPYPPPGEVLSFDDVRVYPGSGAGGSRGDVAVVTYGNGVVTALQAADAIKGRGDARTVDVIDCMLLSSPAAGLKQELGKYERVVFADICKEGANPLSGMMQELKSEGLLENKWAFTSSQKTYNPLGNLLTFMNEDDIVKAVDSVL